MSADLSVLFTGVRFENPFLLSSAPPTESESNILRAFEAGWGGVVTKTIGLHPVVNVRGPKTKFLRADVDSPRLSMTGRPGTALHSSWNWELISDKPLDWWVPRIGRIKKAFPDRVLVASIMAGSRNDTAPSHWQAAAQTLKDQQLISVVTQVVKEVARVPVWAKLTPSTTDIVVEARAAFLGGADAISSSNTFTSLPLIDPETLEFEMNVDGFVSTGGLGGPAILPLSLAKMGQMTKAFPEKSFSGIGGISNFDHALSYFLLGCGTVQVCTAAMLDRAVGPNVIRGLLHDMEAFLEKQADRGGKRLEEFRGRRRNRIVPQSEIARPDESDYHGGHDVPEGYAASEAPVPVASK